MRVRELCIKFFKDGDLGYGCPPIFWAPGKKGKVMKYVRIVVGYMDVSRTPGNGGEDGTG